MAICGTCSGDPVGEACYHICPNSDHFYSERERQDDQFYGDDDNRERYAATIASMEYEDEEWREELAPAVEAELASLFVTVPADTDDIPF